ncbi:MAG: HAMP domain-containing sensor histidine kinase [Pseudomonadota bacterium]
MNPNDPKTIAANFSGTSQNLTFRWLLRLRWATIASQGVLVVMGLKIFHLPVSLTLAYLILCLGLVSNILLHGLLRSKNEIPCWIPSLVMSLDIILMTLLFFNVVSIFNPLNILFIIYIVLGALLLEKSCSYVLATFTLFCYAIFFYFSNPTPFDHSLQGFSSLIESNPELVAVFSSQMDAYFHNHSYFMFFVFFLMVLLIVYPVGQIKKNMQEQDAILKELDEEKMRNEKLASLATFAAGAAHEFSTPLSTIAVAAGEMLFHFKKHGGDKGLIDDTRLIRDQVSRCKEILYQMSADSGKLLGEAVDKFSIKELVYEAMTLFSFENLQQVNFINQVGDLQIVMPVRTLTRTIRELMKNALDASGPGSPIDITCRKDANFLYFEVVDHGSGMDPDFLKRAIEPFYTSKQPGKGMGLGLYLAKIMANRFGGDLKLISKQGEGTTAVLTFALERIAAN